MIQADKHGVEPTARQRSYLGDAPEQEQAGAGVTALAGLIEAGHTSRASVNPAHVLAVQRAAGNMAARDLLWQASLSAGASAQPVQRTVLRAEQSWLNTILAARGGALTPLLSANPASRLWRLDPADRMDTVATVMTDIDPFETAAAASPGLGNAELCRFISALEESLPSSLLAVRLTSMFVSSADPLLGLAAVMTIDQDRVRAVLQSASFLSAPALGVLARRLAGVTVPSHLASAHHYLTTLSAEMAAPTTEGVTASDATRETNVTNILTPPSVVAANAAAAARGEAPPSFVPAGYADDLMDALHVVATREWHNAQEIDRRNPMDTARGGRVEQIAAEAKKRVDALFGIFGSFRAPSMRFGVNLFDQSARRGNAWDMARWFIEDSGYAAINQVNQDHHAFGATAAEPIRRRVINQYSGRAAAPAAVERRLGVSPAERESRLRLTDRMWPGMQQAGRVYLTPREGQNPAETRQLYWNLFKTCIHEYLHTSAHPTYTRWYEGLQDPHHVITYQEGFTDWFTLRAWRSVFPSEVASDPALRQTVQGSTDVDLAAAEGDPSAYPEIREAELIEAEIGLANMRAAYFRGNTAVLGGRRLPR